MKYEEIDLKENIVNHHLEFIVGSYTAFIDYKKTTDKLFLIHTEVPIELEGKGVGSALVEKAFRWAEQSELQVVPLCSFVQLFLKRHPEWMRIVAKDADRFMKEKGSSEP